MTSSNLANFNQTSNSDGLKVQQKQRYESMYLFSQETIRLSPSLKRVLIIQKSKWYNYHRAQTIMLIIWFLKWENLNSQSFELRFISTSINLLTAVSKSFLQVVKVTDHKLGNPPKSHKNPPWASLFCIKFFKPGIQDSSAEETLFLKYKNKWCIGFKIYFWWSSNITDIDRPYRPLWYFP